MMDNTTYSTTMDQTTDSDHMTSQTTVYTIGQTTPNMADICPPERHQELNNLYFGIFKVMFPILISIGIVFNVVNLVVLTRPQMMNKIYRWLRILAVVDITLCVMTIPVCLANSGHTPSNYHLAWYYSKFGWSLSIGSQILSFYMMVWFAYDRYLAVCCHTKYPKSQRTEVYRKRLIGTILFVVVLYIPTMADGIVCQMDDRWLPEDGYSKVHSPWYKAYAWFREIFSRIIPAGLITACNIKIALKLKQLRDIRDGFASGVSASRKEREKRLVILLFWVNVLFYVYNTPVAIYYLVFLNHKLVHTSNEYKVIAFGAISNLIQMMGNVSNFTLYFLINPEFRRTLVSMFCGQKKPTLKDSEINSSQHNANQLQVRTQVTLANNKC